MTTPTPAPPHRPPRVPPVRAFTPEERDRIRAAIDALLARIRKAFEGMAAAVREAAHALTEAFASLGDKQWQLVALDARRTPRPRPAWATPYGPPPRPHRS